VEEIRRSAPSVEEAVEAALTELGVSEQEADIQVVQEPRQGLFGVGAQEAIVVVRTRRQREVPTEEELDEQADVAAEFLEGLLERMGIRPRSSPIWRTGRCTWTSPARAR
jgi:spoIIIJ-associated protein